MFFIHEILNEVMMSLKSLKVQWTKQTRKPHDS